MPLSLFTTRERSEVDALALRPKLAKHSGKCGICRHPRRVEIERDFLDWVGPREIAREYDLGSHTTVYRHAHALGLFEQRQRTWPLALGRLIEQVGEVKPTAASIVSAIRLLAKINARGEYVEETEDAEGEDLSEAAASDVANEAAEADKNGPPMAFAQNVGPGRKFPWR
jgi:hypothetical protein